MNFMNTCFQSISSSVLDSHISFVNYIPNPNLKTQATNLVMFVLFAEPFDYCNQEPKYPFHSSISSRLSSFELWLTFKRDCFMGNVVSLMCVLFVYLQVNPRTNQVETNYQQCEPLCFVSFCFDLFFFLHKNVYLQKTWILKRNHFIVKKGFVLQWRLRNKLTLKRSFSSIFLSKNKSFINE